ncbi:LOW QUALITY PROTEIN: coiled-coil domain-containing protein 190 [Leptodactylus fuscus]
MQRSRHLGSNMDKQWEAERRGAKRAEARLNNGIQEIEEAQHYHMNSMTKEQKRLQKDLMRIKQGKKKKIEINWRASSIRSSSKLTSSPEGPVIASGSSMTLQMRINDFMDGVKKGKAENFPRNGTELLLSGTNTTDIKTSSSRRASICSVTEDGVLKNDLQGKLILASGSGNPQYLRQRRGSFFKEKITFDEEIYAPDGGLRTLHTMPDFMDSLEEARHARYIRHRVKPESEKELSVDEIFQREEIENTSETP